MIKATSSLSATATPARDIAVSEALGSCTTTPMPPEAMAVTRPAFVEVDLGRLAANARVIRAAVEPRIRLFYVVKDDAYGLGAVAASRVGLQNGFEGLAVVTIHEAIELRRAFVETPVLLLGEHLPEELEAAFTLNLEVSIGSLESAQQLHQIARGFGRRAAVHIKINTGMNRFGFSWRDVEAWSRALAQLDSLTFTGVFSHFAQSDEPDKSFAHQQAARFQECLAALRNAGIEPRFRHHANSGGVLDLPDTHWDLVRVGILAHGVYPSSSCRRLPGLKPVMAVKARIVACQTLEPGDTVGYGMRWEAARRSRIGVVPVGYGDGYPRTRNQGHVLVRAQRAPIVGGVTMDALMIDLTDVPEARVGDEVVLMGRQGADEITPQEIAGLRQSVSYEALLGWRHRLPRVYLNAALDEDPVV